MLPISTIDMSPVESACASSSAMYTLSMNNARRFEKGESYVQFNFDGEFCRMRNTLLQKADMTKDAALGRIANLEADGWVEVDPC